MDAEHLGRIRHDLKNAVTALEYGCMLIESRLQPGGDPELREYVAEMRAELAKASALLEELRKPKGCEQAASSGEHPC